MNQPMSSDDVRRTKALGASALQLYTIAETCDLLRVSRWQVYQLINSRQLPSVKINRRRLIARDDLSDFIQGLRVASEAAR